MDAMSNGKTATKLAEIYRNDNSARAILEWFGLRQKDASVIAVERASQMADISYSEALRIFRLLEKLGAGKVVQGRKGHKTRMIFDLSIRSLAAAAIGEIDEPEQIDLAELDPDDSLDVETEFVEEEELVTHKFQLRPDLQISLSLPQSLSAREAERLSVFVRSLPFE